MAQRTPGVDHEDCVIEIAAVAAGYLGLGGGVKLPPLPLLPPMLNLMW